MTGMQAQRIGRTRFVACHFPLPAYFDGLVSLPTEAGGTVRFIVLPRPQKNKAKFLEQELRGRVTDCLEFTPKIGAGALLHYHPGWVIQHPASETIFIVSNYFMRQTKACLLTSRIPRPWRY